jgi:hypothetical protein
MADFNEQPAFEIGRRLEARESYAWFVVLRPSAEPEEALDNFLAELSAVLAQPVRIVQGVAPSLEQVLTELSEPGGDPVLISGLDQADMDYWRALDINRSGLLRVGPVVLWLSSAGLTCLCTHAPNLRSFIGGSIFYLSAQGEALTDNERRQRISDLEAHFQMTASEVIRRAESGTLPGEPHFVEWLVLLGRGDLV